MTKLLFILFSLFSILASAFERETGGMLIPLPIQFVCGEETNTPSVMADAARTIYAVEIPMGDGSYERVYLKATKSIPTIYASTRYVMKVSVENPNLVTLNDQQSRQTWNCLK
jgi:hypothetical protein